MHFKLVRIGVLLDSKGLFSDEFIVLIVVYKDHVTMVIIFRITKLYIIQLNFMECIINRPSLYFRRSNIVIRKNTILRKLK